MADKCFRHTKEGRNEERVKTIVNLANMSEVRRLNSDALPNESRFGTVNNNALCQGDDAKYCPAKFKDLDTRLRVAPRYKTSACVIQKNMSTLMQAIM
ncbi:hypothetical protein AAVH_42303 [Aphelenchoides avenae]|nr:hypothetical protein AAVH_42303 [Aphelenchus avenae]